MQTDRRNKNLNLSCIKYGHFWKMVYKYIIGVNCEKRNSTCGFGGFLTVSVFADDNVGVGIGSAFRNIYGFGPGLL